MDATYKVGDWVLTAADKQLQVKAVFTTTNEARYLLSDSSVYNQTTLRPA